jgi:hypothetical protein
MSGRRVGDIFHMREIAVQESRALREFAKQGRCPKCAPTLWPWDDVDSENPERDVA